MLTAPTSCPRSCQEISARHQEWSGMQNLGHELRLAQLEHAAAVFPGTSGSSVLFSHTGLPWPLHYAASSVLLWGIGWLPGPSKAWPGLSLSSRSSGWNCHPTYKHYGRNLATGPISPPISQRHCQEWLPKSSQNRRFKEMPGFHHFPKLHFHCPTA